MPNKKAIRVKILIEADSMEEFKKILEKLPDYVPLINVVSAEGTCVMRPLRDDEDSFYGSCLSMP